MSSASNGLELAWRPDPTATAYRVVIASYASGRKLFDQEVGEPTVRPRRLLRRWPRSEWRVLVRRDSGGEWELYLPPIIISDEQLEREPELTWDPVPHAVGYRVLVRDDERGEVVSKLGFVDSPGRVQWAGLERSHPHRARVQAWVDGEWHDHVPYQTAFPPPAVCLRPLTRAALRLRHVVVVRFGARSLDDAYGMPRPSALLADRLRLFASRTLGSLQLLADAGVTWSVVAEPDVPDAIADSLRELCGGHFVVGDRDGSLTERAPSGLAVSWIAAGDALHPGVPAAVERRIAALDAFDQPLAIEFPLCVEAGPGGVRLARDVAPACLTVVVEPPGEALVPAESIHPILRLASTDARISDWSVPALLRARPGPNEHPCFLRELGPEIAPELLAGFGPADGRAATRIGVAA